MLYPKRVVGRLAYKVQSEGHAYFLKVYEKSRASTPSGLR